MTSSPSEAGPETICVCNHWFEEHNADGCVGCDVGGQDFGVSLHEFKFDPEGNTPDEIADRGGDPAVWPQWVKDHYGPAKMAEWTS